MNVTNLILFQRKHIFPQLRDGPNTTSPLLDTLCGYSVPATVYSSGDALTLRLRVFRGWGRGYDISYTTSDDAGCGGTLYDTRFTEIFASVVSI